MRAAAILLLLLAGCTGSAVDPLADRGALPEDIAAPPPTTRYDDRPPLQHVGQGWVTGTVKGPGGPVHARVWVETVDLREPVDNRAAYAAQRAASEVWTAADGTYQIAVPDNLYAIAVQADGLRGARFDPTGTRDVVLQTGSPVIIAHRGASFYAPENTVASLEKAVWLGADYVEADVRLDTDGEAVVFHDETLERTSDGTGAVINATGRALLRLDAGSWFDPDFHDQRIPTLAGFLSAARALDVDVVLDVKATAETRSTTWTRTIQVVRAQGMEDHVVFATFRQAGVRACAATAMTCALLSMDAEAKADLVDRAVRNGADWLMVDQAMLDAGLVAEAHSKGLHVHAWTLNLPEEWSRARSLGVDSIATDRPGFLLESLNAQP